MKQWEEFVHTQEQELGTQATNKWLRSLKVVNFDAGNIYLEAQNLFHLEWFEEHIRKKLSSLKPLKVHLRIQGWEKKKKTEEQPIDFELQFEALDPHARLEHYLPSRANEIPFAFLKEIEKSPCNPVYLYGKSGTGKTHLLMSIAHKFPKAIYVTAETFTNHLVKAIRTGMMQTFRSRYRSAEALIIDDIHTIAGRSATQEELFHTFNYLHAEKKLILLSGNSSPGLLTDIEPRLVSRFEWGITLELKKQDNFEEILRKKGELLNFPLTEEQLQFLLTQFFSIKSQQKALMALVLSSHLKQNAPPETLLKKLLEEEHSQKLSSEKIIHQAAIYYGIRAADILGKSQSHECSFPRQITMYLCRKELGLPYQKIGKLFSRDHSTVMTSVKQISKKIASGDSDTLTSLETISRNAEK